LSILSILNGQANSLDEMGVFRMSTQNGQNGQGNGQDFLNILYIFSLSLPAELVTTRDETIGFHLWFFLHCAMKALLWTEREKNNDRL